MTKPTCCPDSISRRALLRRGGVLGAGALAAAALAPAGFAAEPVPAAPGAPPATPAEALARLAEGNRRFAGGTTVGPQRDLARLRAVADKQTPFAAVLGCADSRVPVEILYDQGFGDLFVVRVAGNVATAVEIASLEFGCYVLGALSVTVLGHSNCGAVKAALGGGEVPGQISTLYQHIAPALERKKMDLAAAAIANVQYQMRRLRKGSPLLARLMRENRLTITGGVFDFDTGQVVPVEA